MSPNLDIFDSNAWHTKMLKYKLWNSDVMGTRAAELDKQEEDIKHYIGWLHEAKQGVGELVRQHKQQWQGNPLQLYTLFVGQIGDRGKLGIEVYMGWNTNYAQLGPETRRRRLGTAGLVVDWLYWDEGMPEAQVQPVRDRVNMLLDKMGFARKHHTQYQAQYFANAFQLSSMIQTVGIPRMEQFKQQTLNHAAEAERLGHYDRAKRHKLLAAKWHHDLVKAHLLDFSLPPLTRPLFMKTLQVSVHPDLLAQVPGLPQAECHKKNNRGVQQCTRQECKGNHIHLCADGYVLLYFPHYKNEGKLQPDMHYQLNAHLSGIIKAFVLPGNGQGPGGSDWQLLTATATVVADRRFLMGQCNTVGGCDLWRPMADAHLATTMWPVVLGAPTNKPEPMKTMENGRVRQCWEKLDLIGPGKLLPSDCQPFPPQRIRNMLASAAIVLMEIGVEEVMELVRQKQQVEAVLDMVADAMLSGSSSLHHYTTAEGNKKMQAAAMLLSLVRRYNNDNRCLAAKAMQLTLRQPE